MLELYGEISVTRFVNEYWYEMTFDNNSERRNFRGKRS
jgi:hypothetical protein